MSQFIKVYDNVVTPEYCAEIIEWFNANQELQTTRQETNEGTYLDKGDMSMALPMTRTLYTSKALLYYHRRVVEPVLFNYVSRYAEEFPYLLKMQRQTILQSKIQATPPGGGFHLWHCEHTDTLSSNRVASFVLYLNTVRGGETEFLYQHSRVEPQQGRLVIFPAGYTHVHRGNPPLDQTKYITTGWMEYC